MMEEFTSREVDKLLFFDAIHNKYKPSVDHATRSIMLKIIYFGDLIYVVNLHFTI